MVDSETPQVGAIIVAAGAGTRMGGVDKLFAPLAGRPVLAHSLDAFQRCPAVAHIVLVLAASTVPRGRAFVVEGGFSKVAAVCPGGPRRQDSVRLGLQALPSCPWVAVHDGARPLVTPELILRGLEAARRSGAAVPVVPLVDTIKEVSPRGHVLRTLDRGRLRAVQTPQIFRCDLLWRAHEEVTTDVTDDAAMVEALGLPVATFAGSRRNLKITEPEDLELARALMTFPPS